MDLTVNTRKGKVTGFSEEGIAKWFGIPYAKPPVGELRFKRAQEPESWLDVRECTEMGPKPIQFSAGKLEKFTKTNQQESEDCLYLNVWAPDSQVDKKRPVFIWVFGGAFCAGDASAPEFDLSAFARDDIVGVSFNYRLGVLGFYDFSSVDTSFESNCGMSDIIAVLKWVNENISAFGGDPNNVTVCGASSGGTAVMALMGSPFARHLFNRVIIMSGTLSNITSEKIQLVNRKRLINALDIEKSNISILRDLTAEDLVPGCSVLFEGNRRKHPGLLTCGPVIDDLVTENPLDALESGKLRDKQFIFGTCKDEGGLFYYFKFGPRTWDELCEMLSLNGYVGYDEKMENLYAELKEKDAVKKANTDRMFLSDTIRLASAAARHSEDVYLYRFDLVTPVSRFVKIGATHCMDICPVLDTYSGNMSMFYSRVKKDDLEYIHGQMHGSFVKFIQKGIPSSEEVNWMPFEERKMLTYIFDYDSHPEPEPDKEYYDFWKNISLY